MRPAFAVYLLTISLAASVCAQSISDLEATPKEVVEELWAAAMRGQLLTPQGWKRASGCCTKLVPYPKDRAVVVVSNIYGVVESSVKTDAAEISMECTYLGSIDSTLRFTPAPESKYYKSAKSYQLVPRPRHIVTYGPDGKTKIQDREIPGTRVWQIDEGPGLLGLRWTTVNTAIRYILEERNKTADPVIKTNADRTIAELLQMR